MEICNRPNECENNTFCSDSLLSPKANADIAALYTPSEIMVERVEYEPDGKYHLFARCGLPYGECPYCGQVSRRVHSRYVRTFTDLSILGRCVTITFESRKFFCENPSCDRKTFAEQPGDEIFRYRRRTRRCEIVVVQHGLNGSSETSRRLLCSIGIPISGDTVLRDLHRIPVPECAEVENVGVDDWAFRKGVTYGSIIVDLNSGSVIDLLGDRNVESFKCWLDKHPEVSVVSRDRSTDYTAAIAATGRDITEVADRFHLSKNMSDCLAKVLGSHYEDYRRAVRPEDNPSAWNKADPRQAMFSEVKDLQGQGLGITQTARKLGIARQTVRKYMSVDTLPQRASKERHPYYLYDAYVEESYRQGKDMLKIHSEIKSQGFTGSLTPFYDHYRYLSDGHRGYRPKHEVNKKKELPSAERDPLISVRQMAHIADKSIRNKKMELTEQMLVDKMMTFGWFREIQEAASTFYRTIMGQDVENLTSWLAAYGKSPIAELHTFAYGIRMDLNAVQNAITEDVSNGIVEGYVNKLKAIKRVMYGKASIELLRRKMVFSNLCFN
jgi:transposase